MTPESLTCPVQASENLQTDCAETPGMKKAWKSVGYLNVVQLWSSITELKLDNIRLFAFYNTHINPSTRLIAAITGMAPTKSE